MLNKNVSQLLRIFAIILLSYVSVSCGSGNGKEPINTSPEDVTSGTLALIFEDDFGGPATAANLALKAPLALASKSPLPLDNWRVETGYGPNNDGNGNDEWQLYQNSIDNLYIENGSLVISAQCSTAPACGKRDDSITSAKIDSKNRLNIKYGSVQARIKMPSGLGMWPAFWMLGSDFPGLAWPDAGEIDIVEMHYFFSDIQTTHFATHWAGPRYAPGEAPVCASGVGALSPDEQENCDTSDEPEPKTFDFPLTDDFHIFELEWTDKVIIGKIDGITYFTQGIDPDTMEEFQKDYYLILNVAVGGTLGGPFGPQMSAADWADPNQTNMLVDWVRVFQNVPSSAGTLIAESGKNLDFNRIINSAEVGGAFVESDLDSTAVEALVGNEVLSLIYSTSVSENGGVPAGFSAALFDFNRIDLSSFTTFVFSINTVDFPNFDDFFVKFEDSGIGAVEVHLSTLTPIAINADWTTYEIPLSDFAGVDLKDITIIGFFNPVDSSDTLIAGTLYIDDIRFETEECTATGSVAFDSINYNPATSVASVSVDDICAASSLAVVKVETGTDEIVVGVNLDAAGQGETIFNLVKSDSVCSTDDELSLIKLSSPLMATYTRTFVDAGGTQQVNTATATAGIDPSAPGTTIVGETSFIYATDPTQPLGFVPDTDFGFSDFGTGSQFNGNFTTDTTFSPVFSVSNSASSIGVLALFEFTSGFAANAESINFKVKDMPNNFIEVSFGDPKTTFPVDLLTYSGSTSIGDGWFEVSIPMTEFPDVGDNTFVQFTSDNSSPAAFTYLITDIFLQESAGNAPAECDNVILPPVAGSGTGATGATGGPLSVSFDDSAVTYGFTGFGDPDTITALNADPVDGTNMVAVTTKPVGAQVWAGVTVEPVPGITWPVSVAESEITIRIYAPGPGLVVHMKLEESATAANSVEAEAVTTVTTGWETLTFDFSNPVAGSPAINPAFAYDKLSLFFGFGTPGDGTTYTWDTIEFQGTGGGPGGELLTNGDFETGDLSGWTEAPNGGTITADNTQNSGSTWSAHAVAGAGENPSLSQVNLAIGTVMPGDTIDISFDMCGSAANGGVIFPALLSEFGLGIGADRTTLDTFANPASVWTRFNYSVPTGVNVDGGISLQFDVVCGADAGCSADVYFDNVSVTVGGGTAPGTASGQSCGGGAPATEPVVAAPMPPSRNAADVKSLFSDAYSDVGIDTWRTVWSAATLDETFVVGGSATKLYTALDFVGIEFMNPQIDASTMTHFHVDIWTPDATSGGEVFRVKLVDFGAATTEHEIVFDATTTPALATGAWVSMDIPLSDFTNLAGTANLGQLIFSGTLGGGPGLGTVYVDNVYFYNSAGGPATEPPVAAPMPPSRNAADVESLFSDAYSDVVIDTWRTVWSAATLDETFVVGGSATKLYTDLDFVGIEFMNPQINASAMTHFHVDIWTPDTTSGGEVFRVKLVDFGAATTEHEIVFDSTTTPALVTGAWVSMDIPLSDFTNLAGTTNLGQLIFSGTLGGGPGLGTVYVDNVYFYNSAGGGGSGEIAVNAGFETGDFTGWTQFESTPGNQTVNTGTPGDTSSEGTRHLQINNVTAGSNSLVKQERVGLGTVTPGIAWTVTFDARGSFNTGGVAFAQVFSETAGGNEPCTGCGILGGVPLAVNADPTVWTSFSFSGTAGPTTESLTLQLEAITGASNLANMFYDNISIIVGP